jgi:hypothetical protein
VFYRDFIAFLVVKIEGGSGSHDLGCFWWVWWADIAKKVPVRTDYCDQARKELLEVWANGEKLLSF